MTHDQVEKSLLGFVIGLITGTVFVVCMYTCSGLRGTEEYLRAEAVRLGHAEYVVDKDGKPQWQWKRVWIPEKQEVKP